MTNRECIKDATEAMRVLRNHGSKMSERQADSIQRLISRLSIYENKLVSIHLIVEEIIRNHVEGKE